MCKPIFLSDFFQQPMKYLVSIALVILLFSCSGPAGQQPGADSTNTLTGPDTRQQRKILIASLLEKYKLINFDTFAITSVLDNEEIPVSYQFHGEALDSEMIDALSPKKGTFASEYGCFACYRFQMDKKHVGLITRVGALHDATSLRLLVLDTATGVIRGETELADLIHDEGEVVRKSAWLFKTKALQFQTLVKIYYSMDNSVNDEKDKTIDSSDTYSLLRLHATGCDTLSVDSSALTQQFGHLLHK